MLVVVIAVVLALVILVVIGVRRGAVARGPLNWDPDDNLRHRAAQDDADVEEMLALHNEHRVARGLPRQTRAEYEERVRRR